MKLFKADFIYGVFSSPWVSPIHVLPKKSSIIVKKKNENVKQCKPEGHWVGEYVLIIESFIPLLRNIITFYLLFIKFLKSFPLKIFNFLLDGY